MSETVCFGLTVPTDRRFHEIVRAFCVRVVAYLGLSLKINGERTRELLALIAGRSPDR